METTTLQVPLPKTLKNSATVVAKEYGFSSLQEIIRILLTKLARRQLVVQIEETVIPLSLKAEQRYLKIAQDYAKWNRAAMVQVLMEALNLKEVGRIDTVHNYIDLEHMILRKGAISARKDELVLIPINMRDGSLLAKGKGNDDWNQSGPHGAGRILSRTKAKQQLHLNDFTDTMKHVYTTSVSEDTIDESPFAYKPMEEIIRNTGDTIEIQSILKPLYNFKAAEFQGWRKK